MHHKHISLLTVFHKSAIHAAGKWQAVKKKWTDIKVGDVVKVMDNELFPADLMCLHCELEERICFVKTTNLDGETNLKVKRCVLMLVYARRSCQPTCQHERASGMNGAVRTCTEAAQFGCCT